MQTVRRLLTLAVLVPVFFSDGYAEQQAPEPPSARGSVELEAPSGLLSVSEIADLVKPSLVKITQVGREGPYGIGSGFVVGSDGLIATNRHVIGEGRRIKVETSDGRQHEVSEVVASDARLDLAIVRVASRELKALVLADSRKARQGQPIVAMGNPMGMTYSVVEGVISEPQREIEGQPMLQVAVPIEQGNSGGPLLDRQGRVLGLLTLKSALSENLGFAMPVNALKLLMEKPNSIPMERWLTIGVLNPRFWKTLLGAQWSQRAGIVNVSQSGAGFGGRSLCLWHEEPPSDVFEATVTVRLQDEAGAAGLAFCADGKDRHYGFYPTGGRMRLTRFDGPDVFSWKILEEKDVAAYRAGDWNTLRVSVNGERIQCFVNETPVFDLQDSGMRGGRAGLCKFRATEAGFKKFKVGLDLAERGPSLEEADRLRKTVELALEAQTEADRERVLLDFGSSPVTSRHLLEEKRKRLQGDVLRLGELEVEIHRRSIREQLLEELRVPGDQSGLLRCALLLAKHDNPELDIESYERGFAQMVQELKGQPEFGGGVAQAVHRLNWYLFEENGFHGSRSEYGSRSNSYVNEVLDDREGLPITLSVVYLELARRLGIHEVVGIPLPGRFMVGYRESAASEYTFLDVYDGGKELSLEQAAALVSEDGVISQKARTPATNRDIILRMIRNLLGPLLESRGPAKESLPYLDLLLALDPEAARERVSRAMLRERSGDKRGARLDVGWLWEHLPEGAREEQKEMLEQWIERLSR
jgi:S1-C subfamily serine protease/regulator of sirC expression with transglutaminase-like and TPR domain